MNNNKIPPKKSHNNFNHPSKQTIALLKLQDNLQDLKPYCQKLDLEPERVFRLQDFHTGNNIFAFINEAFKDKQKNTKVILIIYSFIDLCYLYNKISYLDYLISQDKIELHFFSEEILLNASKLSNKKQKEANNIHLWYLLVRIAEVTYTKSLPLSQAITQDLISKEIQTLLHENLLVGRQLKAETYKNLEFITELFSRFYHFSLEKLHYKQKLWNDRPKELVKTLFSYQITVREFFEESSDHYFYSKGIERELKDLMTVTEKTYNLLAYITSIISDSNKALLDINSSHKQEILKLLFDEINISQERKISFKINRAFNGFLKS